MLLYFHYKLVGNFYKTLIKKNDFYIGNEKQNNATEKKLNFKYFSKINFFFIFKIIT